MTPQVKICPAAAAAQTLPEEPQWGEFRQLPASKESRIDFADYARAHTVTHKLNEGRRMAAPEWAFSGLLLAEVITRMFEQRAGFRKPTPGGNLDRLQRAQAVLFAAIPRTQAILKRLCDEYVQLKQQNDAATAKRLRFLENNIHSLDTTIHLTKSFPATCARVCYLYYNLGWNSVAIGEACGIMPPLARKIIWKMNRTWELLQREKAEGVQPYMPPHLIMGSTEYRKEAAARARQAKMLQVRAHAIKDKRVCAVCGAEFKPRGPRSMTCGKKCSKELHRRQYTPRPAAAPRVCTECGKEFTPRPPASVNSKRCSPECRAAHWRKFYRDYERERWKRARAAAAARNISA